MGYLWVPSEEERTGEKMKKITRNAIVRSTLTYGLTISNLSDNDKEIMEKFTHRCIRAIDREGKWDGKNNPHTTRRETYIKNDQPTTASWINYLRLRHAIQDQGTIERTLEGIKDRKTEAIKMFQKKMERAQRKCY